MFLCQSWSLRQWDNIIIYNNKICYLQVKMFLWNAEMPLQLSAAIHICNPSALKVKAGRLLWEQGQLSQRSVSRPAWTRVFTGRSPNSTLGSKLRSSGVHGKHLPLVHLPSSQMVFCGSKSGLHTCAVNCLPTEPSPSPLLSS